MTGNFHHTQTFRNVFKNRCIQLLIDAYAKVLFLKTIKLDWMENDITVELYEHIDNNQTRLDWNIVASVEYHLPDKSIPKERGYANKYPRIDMGFVVTSRGVEYKYFLEAKNVKENDSVLKRRYIHTGIDNFVNGKYSNGCLVMYLLEGDLCNTIDGINKLLKEDDRVSEILKKNKSPYHEQYYISSHPNLEMLEHYALEFTFLKEFSPYP